MITHDILRARLLSRVIDAPVGQVRADLDTLLAQEWSQEFEALQRARLAFGRFRYGNRPGYDRAGSAVRRLQEYQRTGNVEHLVDAANLAMMEFLHGKHPLRHFAAEDEHGLHMEPAA